MSETKQWIIFACGALIFITLIGFVIYKSYGNEVIELENHQFIYKYAGYKSGMAHYPECTNSKHRIPDFYRMVQFLDSATMTNVILIMELEVLLRAHGKDIGYTQKSLDRMLNR